MARAEQQQHDTLVAVAETALPAGRFIPARGRGDGRRRSSVRREACPRSSSAGSAGLLRGARCRVVARRAAAVRAREAGEAARAARELAPRRSDPPADAARAGQPAQDRALRRPGALQAARLRLRRREGRRPRRSPRTCAIACIDADELGGDLAVECDVVVVGTGAGGAVVGRELAEAGPRGRVRRGRPLLRSHATSPGRAFEMQQKLYRRGGATFSVGNVGIPIPLGQTGRRHDDGQLRHVLPHARSRARATGSDDLGLDELGPEQLGAVLRSRRGGARRRARARRVCSAATAA